MSQSGSSLITVLDRHLVLSAMSLTSIVLVSFHMTEDVVRGFEPGGFDNVRIILIMAVWLYGTLALAGKKSGVIIMLLGSLLGTLISLAHMRGGGVVGGRIAGSSGMFFWVWTILALGATSACSVLLAAWMLMRRRA